MSNNHPPAGTSVDLRMYTMKQVCELTGYSRTHIYRIEGQSSGFPMRVKIGPGSIRFWAREVEAWLLSRPRGGTIRFDGDDEGTGVSP